jgi:hypothetical protein
MPSTSSSFPRDPLSEPCPGSEKLQITVGRDQADQWKLQITVGRDQSNLDQSRTGSIEPCPRSGKLQITVGRESGGMVKNYWSCSDRSGLSS